jgi:hypothetical protein
MAISVARTAASDVSGRLPAYRIACHATEGTTAAFVRGLSEVGFAEDRNVTLEYRFADGQIDRLRALADDLVRGRVNVIAAMSGSHSALAKGATIIIPIVFALGVRIRFDKNGGQVLRSHHVVRRPPVSAGFMASTIL